MTALEKQIEAARKAGEKYQKNIAMYNARADKRIAELAAKGYTVSRDDFEVVKAEFGYDVKVAEHVRAEMPWTISYPVENALLSAHENAMHYQRGERRLAELLEKQRQKEAAAAVAVAKYDSRLEAAFAGILKPFYNKWWAERREWYRNHYDYILAYLPEARQGYADNDKKRSALIYDRKRYTSEYNRIDALCKRYAEIIADPAGKSPNFNAYLKDRHREFDDYYKASLVKLVDKCAKFQVDAGCLRVRSVAVSAKGFDMEIYDGKNRVISARAILAAEYSSYVSEHLRYIVTERALVNKNVPEPLGKQAQGKEGMTKDEGYGRKGMKV